MSKRCSPESEQHMQIKAEANLTKLGQIRQRVDMKNECRSSQKK